MRRERYLDPAPPQRLAGLRILTGAFALGYLLVRLPHLVEVAGLAERRFDPVGPLSFLDRPVPEAVAIAAVLAAIGLGVAYALGWCFRLTGPAFAVLLLAVLTYRNSWGQVFHTENLLVLHVLVVGLTPAAAAWSIDRRRWRGPAPGTDPRYGWPVRVVSLITVTAYVVAGWAKIRTGGWGWVTGEVLVHQVGFDNVRKVVLGDVHSPIGAALLGRDWLFGPMAVLTLAVELGAPFALLTRRLGRLWSAAAWCFHVGILALMAIVFPYQLSGIAFASFFRLEQLPDRLRRVAISRRGRGRGRRARDRPGAGTARSRPRSPLTSS